MVLCFMVAEATWGYREKRCVLEAENWLKTNLFQIFQTENKSIFSVDILNWDYIFYSPLFCFSQSTFLLESYTYSLLVSHQMFVTKASDPIFDNFDSRIFNIPFFNIFFSHLENYCNFPEFSNIENQFFLRVVSHIE